MIFLLSTSFRYFITRNNLDKKMKNNFIKEYFGTVK